MRAQFVIPVIVSILILGTLGLSQEALAAIHEGPPLNNPTEEYVYVGSATVDFDGFPNDSSGNGEITGNEFIAQGVVFSTPDLNLNIGGTTVSSPPNSLGADKTSVNDFDGDIVFEFIDECVSSDVEFLIFNPPFSATAFDINGNPLATLVGSSFTETFSFVGLPVHKVQISGSFYAIDDLTFTLECIPPPPPPPPSDEDHYLAYQVKELKKTLQFKDLKVNVDLKDQFDIDAQTYIVKKPKMLYNPVEKQVVNADGNVETTPIQDPVTHFMGYQIKIPKGDPKFVPVSDIQVSNQFGTINVNETKRV